MLNTVKEWVTAVLAVALILVVLMFGGVLFTVALALTILAFIVAIGADIILGMGRLFASLFRSHKGKR